MKNLLVLFWAVIYLWGCDKATDPDVGVDSEVSAKENVNTILQKARLDFSPDAKLTGIYGWNVDVNGEVDLLKTDNAFVYVVQSNSLSQNEFYVPVFATGPVKSPITFTTMLSLVKDTTAENILTNVFNRLSTLAIDENAVYKDSPEIIDIALNNGGNTFVNQNSGAKIDMFLVPSKSIDTTLTVNNAADWIINFYSNSKSLVLWINSNSGAVTKISGS
jgi:hypothetical protein